MKGQEHLLSSLRRGVKSHPGSGLLREYLAIHLMSSGQNEKMLELIKRGEKNDRTTPLLRYLVARHYLAVNAHDKAWSWAKKLKGHSHFSSFTGNLEVVNSVRSVKSPSEFIKNLEPLLEPDQFEKNMRRLSSVEPPLLRQEGQETRKGLLVKKDKDFLTGLLKNTERPEIRVLVARALTKKERFKEAHRIYKSLSQKHPVHDERKTLIAAANKNGTPLNTRIKDTTNLNVLHTHALEGLKEENIKKSLRATRRIIDQIESSGKHSELYQFIDDGTEKVVKLARDLAERKKTSVVRKYVTAFLKNEYTSTHILHEESFRDTVKSVFGEDKNALYKLVRHLENNYYRQRLMDEDKMEEIVQRRMNNKKADLPDYLYLARLVKERGEWGSINQNENRGKKLKQIRKWLSKGAKKHPKNRTIQIARADAQLLLGEYKQAVESYRKIMNTDLETDRDENAIQIQRSFSEQDANEKHLQAEHPVFLKRAWALKQLNQTDRARKILRNQLDDSGNLRNRSKIAFGMHLIGDTKEAVQVLREAYIARRKKSGQNNMMKVHRLAGITSRLISYLKLMDRPYEALFIAKQLRKEIDDVEQKSFLGRRKEKMKEEIKTLRKNVSTDQLKKEFLKQSFSAPKAAQKKRIQELIKQLRAPQYQKRKKALAKLKKFDVSAVPVLKNHLKDAHPQVRSSIKQLILFFARRHKNDELKKKYNTD